MASRPWIEKTAPELKREPTLCNGLVAAIVASLRSQADDHGVRLVVSENSDDVVVRTDRRLLSRLVIGILADAIRFSPGGMVHVSVHFRGAGGRNGVEISIAEMPPRDAAVSIGQDADLFGLGEGQALATMLGGKIAIHRRLGQGSTHVLHIPEL